VTRFQRWFLYGSTVAATVSGVAYFWMNRFLEPADPWAAVNHPLEPWALKAHILTAPLMLFAVGLVTTQHIVRNLRSSLPTGRRSGLMTAMVFGPLVLTGYLIQTITAPVVANVLGWIHLSLGVTCAAALALHSPLLRGRRLQAQSSSPRRSISGHLGCAHAGIHTVRNAGRRPTRRRVGDVGGDLGQAEGGPPGAVTKAMHL
jgi:hypothetical protein